MSSGKLSDVANICNGVLNGTDVAFTGVSTDTRSLRAHDLFIALSGPSFNGHDFLEQAKSLDAAGFVVSEKVHDSLPHVYVEDTRKALGLFASSWRQRFDIPVAAVTGSNGKTGTKEMLAAILRVDNDTLATSGNLNNDIGVPMTLLRLTRNHRSAVIEVGTNARGEIAYLAELVKPTVAIITNAYSAHLEGLGDLDGVAKEKGSLLASLDEKGTAVINLDDRYADYWRSVSSAGSVLTFGENDEADFKISDVEQNMQGAAASISFMLKTPIGQRRMNVPLAGVHNALNAAGAAAVAYAMGASLDAIEQGLAQANGVAGRMQVHSAVCGARLIDDSYNSNPASARAAIRFLAEQKEPGWLVLGDMGELGSNAPNMHAALGKEARELGVERLFAVGPLSRDAVAAFGEGANWYESVEQLSKALTECALPGVNILIKASRSMRLERVTAALKRSEPASNAKQEVPSC